MAPMKFTTEDGSTITVTPVAGGGYDAHLRNAAGETTATVHIADHGSDVLAALAGARV